MEITTPMGNALQVAVLGNHTPRQCGIATFTADLIAALRGRFPGMDCLGIAMNDTIEGYDYPPIVRYQIQAENPASYQNVVDALNGSPTEVVCLQHEYGIFGGKSGSHILTLLERLRQPIVTTLHTILRQPTPEQRVVMAQLTRLSDRLVVMSQRGAQFLQQVHGVHPDKIDIIHHGIPSLGTANPTHDKAILGLAGKSVLLTFGLLSPDKGIENVIEAMPALIARFPNTVYLVVGATHPQVRKQHGEAYRRSLAALAERLGVEAHVLFYNRFVPIEELTQFLRAADIYITPYLKPEQITSGTLAYAVGSGKAVISTPYYYAQELLAEGRGVLVPWRNPSAIAHEVQEILGNPDKCRALQSSAAAYGQEMTWPRVAERYHESFLRSRSEKVKRPHRLLPAKVISVLSVDTPKIPPLNLTHLRHMTDDTGLFQHATFDIPNRAEGYCVDDNARALLLMILLEQKESYEIADIKQLTVRYLSFVQQAFNPATGRFRNFLSFDRQWLETQGSEDSHGRTMWALGTVVGHSHNPGWCRLASQLFQKGLLATETFTSPRAWAYTLLGLDASWGGSVPDATTQELHQCLAERLLRQFTDHSSPEWPWLENSLTYANARLSQALLVSGRRLNNQAMIQMGLDSLTWLSSVQRSAEGFFSPIGSGGFYVRGGDAALFDQQPIEACGMVSACREAFLLTDDMHWLQRYNTAFSWFLGQNILHMPLYDPLTGGCCDGLHADRLNENQGAESTLSFLQALLAVRSTSRAQMTRMMTQLPDTLAPPFIFRS